MRLALLHRRLVAAMALSALAAYAAGAGASPSVLVAAAGIALSLFWLPPPEWSAWLERAARVGVLVFFAWAVWSVLGRAQDFMGPVLGMLLFLLVTESLRALDAKNDVRLYSLSFALLIAGTAYYPGLGFGVAFAAYVALATLGMMMGFLRRQAERFRVAELRIGRRFLWTTAALSGVTLAMAVTLFVLFPRLPRQWNVQGRRGPAAQQMAGFSDQVSIGEFGGRIAANPQVMFRVEFPDGPPADVGSMHWRGRSFDGFDGRRWYRSRSSWVTDLPARQYAIRWGGPFREVRVFGGPPGADVLFGPHPIVNVSPRSAVRVWRDHTGDVTFFGSDNPVYNVVSTAARLPDARLREAEGADGPALGRYLQLPALDPRVARLADSLAAGETSRIGRVRAVERWLQTELSYTLDLPRTRADATLESFLFRRRQGHCEYFSTAMVVLLRARGIPARNVTGFLGGEWNANGGYLAVTGNNAHSWVEAWFPGFGWVEFDPTPPSREGVVEGFEGSWAWGARLWVDGLEYRWYKWVVDYNLERQLSVFHGVGEMFSRDPAARRTTGGGGAGGWMPWALGVVGILLLVWMMRMRRGTKLPPEARAYLALRRAYARAGFPARDGDGPLAFAQSLEREDAPGADSAARVVDLYVRARFAPAPLDDARRELAEQSAEARAAIRTARKRRPQTA